MIILLGTSHVSNRSKREVLLAIQETDIVAIELDRGRAHGLLQGREATFRELRAALGLKGAVIASAMRSIQKTIGKNIGVVPGVEMKAALLEASRQQKTVALIDRDIRVTLERLSKNFGWREIKQIIKDSFRKRKLSIHPSDDVVLELLEELKERYPRLYTVLVAERDTYMARALLKVQHDHPDKTILAVVGKGHLPGLQRQINYLNETAVVSLWSSPAKK